MFAGRTFVRTIAPFYPQIGKEIILKMIPVRNEHFFFSSSYLLIDLLTYQQRETIAQVFFCDLLTHGRFLADLHRSFES